MYNKKYMKPSVKKEVQILADNQKEKEKQSHIGVVDVARWGHNVDQLDELDDWTTEWNLVKYTGGIWGGRRRGGRGIRLNTGLLNDVVVDNITLQFASKTLLSGANLRFFRGHVYGLIGANGVGKSTLLRRMARGSVPGLSIHLKFVFLQQELPSVSQCSVFDYIYRMAFAGNTAENGLQDKLKALREEELAWENLLNGTDNDDSSPADTLQQDAKQLSIEEMENITEQLCKITDEIESLEIEIKKQESIGTKTLEEKFNDLPEYVKVILKGLKVCKPLSRLAEPMSSLSGGWRMRVALATALISCKDSHVLLLDEATNHMDLPSIVWLQNYLNTETDNLVVIVVSHDRSFMDEVCTDIVELKDSLLKYFAGNFSEWEFTQHELELYNNNKLDAQHRKEDHIKKSMELAKQRGDDNAIRAKKKKLERSTMSRGIDGKRFKLRSWAKIDENCIRFPKYFENLKKDKQLHFKFPVPDISTLHASSSIHSSLIALDNVSIHWQSPPKDVLKNVTLQITLSSRIAIVGPNGQGKSSLLQTLLSHMETEPMPTKSMNQSDVDKSTEATDSLITADADGISKTMGASLSLKSNKNKSKTTDKPTHVYSNSRSDDVFQKGNLIIKGHFTMHHNLRIALVSQHHIDSMSEYLSISPVQYLEARIAHYKSLPTATLPAEFSNMTSLEIRAHLGNFGLSGGIALQPIWSLSGGQKARLAFAAVCILKPHILLLDEPSNNLSVDATNALAIACNDFKGAIVLVSHNYHLLCQVCKELVIVNKGTVESRKSVNAMKKVDQPIHTGTDGKRGNEVDRNRKGAVDQVVVSGEESFEEILNAYITEQLQ